MNTVCKRCREIFLATHFNQTCCNAACKLALRREAQRRYKHTPKGKAAEARYRLSPAKQAIDKAYRASTRGKAVAVARATRLLASDPHLRVRKRLNQTAPYKRLRLAVIREEQACRRCGATDDLTLDHIIPMRMGGSNERANLQCLCRGCNAPKKLNVVAYAPAAAIL